jgi:hypothetical protein
LECRLYDAGWIHKNHNSATAPTRLGKNARATAEKELPTRARVQRLPPLQTERISNSSRFGVDSQVQPCSYVLVYLHVFRGRLCFPAKPEDGGAQVQGDPQYSAPGFQPSSRWSARLQPLTRERLAVFPHALAVSSHLDEISGCQRTKCRSSWKATLLRDG